MAGYSKTPLVKKLGIKENFRVQFISPPNNYLSLLKPFPEGLSFDKNKELDFIHLFVNKIGDLEVYFPELSKRIKKNGMIWVSWYKKSSGLNSELTEDIIRDTGLALGLVDIKVCAVDENWSALKFVIRKANR